MLISYGAPYRGGPNSSPSLVSSWTLLRIPPRVSGLGFLCANHISFRGHSLTTSRRIGILHRGSGRSGGAWPFFFIRSLG